MHGYSCSKHFSILCIFSNLNAWQLNTLMLGNFNTLSRFHIFFVVVGVVVLYLNVWQLTILSHIFFYPLIAFCIFIILWWASLVFLFAMLFFYDPVMFFIVPESQERPQPTISIADEKLIDDARNVINVDSGLSTHYLLFNHILYSFYC
jgi:hypothetical protein